MMFLKRVSRDRSLLGHKARDASPWRLAVIALAVAVGSALLVYGALSASAQAQDAFSSGVQSAPKHHQRRFSFSFPQQGGAAIYHDVCQGCHMPNAKGACGAGCYPALAGDPALAAPGFAVRTVMNGLKAMPAFGRRGMLTNRQIADVLNYIRTHFGNHYSSTITIAQVNAARHSTGATPGATR